MQTTTSPLFTYPFGEASIALPRPSGSTWADNSPWTEVIDETPEAWILAGITVGRESAGLGGSSLGCEFDINIGGDGDDIIASIRHGGFYNELLGIDSAVNGGRLPLPLPIDLIPAGSRISARFRSSDSSHHPAYLALNYYKKPIVGSMTTTTARAKTLPASAGVSLTADAAPWTYGDWEVIYTVDGAIVLTDYIADGVPFAPGPPIDIELGLGDPGSEVAVATLPVRYGSYFAIGHRTVLPVPLAIAAGTISARIRSSAGGDTLDALGLGYLELPL